jgi:hypothetical protein
MSMVAAWAVFPALIVALATGCGLLLEAVAGRRMPGPLVPVAGLALIIVVGQLATTTDATAELATPLVVALAATGALVGLPGRRRRPDPWTLAAAVGAFAVFGAPVLLSGEATFSGYIKLDDTATWLAITDRVMEHGRSLDGLAPSSYEATLDFNLGNGYPIGAFLPLGVGAALSGEDPAWVFQPYVAVLGGMLALALSAIAAPFVASPRMRAAVAFVAAQPALLVGYSQWGGVKEVAAAALLPLVAGLVVQVAQRPVVAGSLRLGAIRMLIPLAVASAALVAVLSIGGMAWLAPLLLPVAVVLVRRIGPRTTLRWAGGFVAIALVLAVPALALGGVVAPWARPLTSEGSFGNLLGPLSPLQVVGIWPSGDFRLDPELDPLTGVLIALTIGAAIGGLALGVRARAWTLLTYAVGGLAACMGIVAFGSPWVDGKALAIASPCVLLLAAAGAAAAGRSSQTEDPRQIRSRICRLVLIAIATGVVWSNLLAYREVTLAPRSQLVELERIGERIAGQGPTLMTEYQPYGVRHFLREADPEGVSELRRRRIPLRDGSIVRTGRYADTDELEPGAVLAYRTLVLRRSPVQSRPPGPYRPVFRGEHYDVWQRRGPATGAVLAHLGLGSGVDPLAAPRCAAVRRVARRAGPGGRIAAATRPAPTVVPLTRTARPDGWGRAGDGRNRVLPRGGGAIEARASVQATDRYDVWLGGSVRSRLDLSVDGRLASSVHHQLNNSGQYMWLGRTRLSRGTRDLDLRLADPDQRPGSGGQPLALGPLALSRAEAPDSRIVRIEPGRARRLCDGRWDWIEAVS